MKYKQKCSANAILLSVNIVEASLISVSYQYIIIFKELRLC